MNCKVALLMYDRHVLVLAPINAELHRPRALRQGTRYVNLRPKDGDTPVAGNYRVHNIIVCMHADRRR